MLRVTAGNEPSINEWNKFLNELDEIKLDKKDAKDKLLALKERANNNSVMTYRQKDGIMGRCEHQINLLANPNLQGKDYKPSDYDQKRMNNKGIKA